MLTIFITGFKGGSGKTTLAVNLCRYLYFYEKTSVALAGFDIQKMLARLATAQNCPFPVTEMEHTAFPGLVENLTPQPSYLIVDCPASVSSNFISILPHADYFFLPFEYTLQDYYKLSAFMQLAKTCNLDKSKIFLAPNCYTEKAFKSFGSYFAPLTEGTQLLPFIPRSSSLNNLSFSTPEKAAINAVRPNFINLINKITN